MLENTLITILLTGPTKPFFIREIIIFLCLTFIIAYFILNTIVNVCCKLSKTTYVPLH